MNVNEIKNDNNDLHVKVIIPFAEINSEVEKELVQLAKNAKIDGFRVGKVPASFLKKKYGISLRADAIKNRIIKAQDEIIRDRNLRIIMEPEVEGIKNEEGKDVEFILKYQLLPEISIPDFKKISIEKPILDLKDKDIQAHLEKLAEHTKEYNQESKSKAGKGDQVTIDAVGYIEGKEFAGGNLKAHKLVLGSKSFIPGFEDQLIGAKSSGEVTVKVDFPENYHEKTLAGKPAEFKVKILAIHNETQATLDDDFAKKFNLENLEQLKSGIAKNLQDVYGEQIETIMKMELFDKLEEILDFQAPESLLERETGILEKQFSESGDEELEGKSDKAKKAYFAKLASRRVKLGLMLAEYVKLHKLQIEKDDINKAIIAQAKSFPGRETAVIDFYTKNPSAIDSLKGPILEEKAVREIFAKEVKLVEKSYTKSKLEKLLEKVNGGTDVPPSGHEEEHVHGPDCQHDHDHAHDASRPAHSKSSSKSRKG